MDPSPTEMVFKIIILGDLSSGKTNIINRYVSNKFVEDSKPTIGVEMFEKNYKIAEDSVTAQIWDTAGQEKYNSLTSSYYRGAQGAIVVYDITQKDSFEKVEKLVNDLREKSETKIYIILVGNKIDKEQNRIISKEEGENLAEKLKIDFCEVSAKSGDGIDNVFQKLIDKVYNIHKGEFKSMASIELENEQKVNLEINNNTNETKKKKCCK